MVVDINADSDGRVRERVDIPEGEDTVTITLDSAIPADKIGKMRVDISVAVIDAPTGETGETG